MPTLILTVTAWAAGVLGLLALAAGVFSVRRRKHLRALFALLLTLVFLLAGALLGLIVVSTRGYRALTHEETAALVHVRPTGAQRFEAEVRLPGGKTARFDLDGDQLYVDAKILKWKYIGNVLGLKTAYELDRIGGRYIDIQDERDKPRTVYLLSPSRGWDLFKLRLEYAALRPLVDARYGSASFVPANEPATFEVRVSTTGLLIRRERPGGNGLPR
ncbi:MAG: hypothetical protein P8018_03910 [Acidobacteriota bacterium]